MELALAEARAAAAEGEVPIGCVVVCDGAVIARGHNRTVSDHDPTAHAEMLALKAAAAALGTERLTACDIYVTLEPCAMCAAALSFARAAFGIGVRFFASPSCHHRPEVYGGIAETEAVAQLRDFFAERR